MAIENIPLFSAMNREEVKPPFPHPHRPMTSQEAHFAIMEKVNACIAEVNNFERRVSLEMDKFMDATNVENSAFKEAIQAAHNGFITTIQNEVNNFESSIQNNYDLFKGDIDLRIADFQTALNKEFATLQENVVKASNGKIEEMEELKISLNKMYSDFTAAITNNFNIHKTQVDAHMEEQDSKIEEYKNYMVNNLPSNVERVFDEKAQTGEIAEIMKNVYGSSQRFMGALTYDEIQAVTNATNGDYYYCTTDAHYYQRSESSWVDIGNGERLADDYEAFKIVVSDKFSEHYSRTNLAHPYNGEWWEEIPLTFKAGYINGVSGAIRDEADEKNKHSEMIKVTPNEELIAFSAIGGSAALFNFYDINKNYVSYKYSLVTAGFIHNAKTIVPDNCYYCCINNIDSTCTPILARKNTMKECHEKLIENINLANLQMRVENEKPLIAEFEEVIFNTASGYIAKTAGGLLENYVMADENSTLTDPINIKEYPELYVTARGQYRTAIVILCDKNGRPVATFGHNDGDMADEDQTEYKRPVNFNREKLSIHEYMKIFPYCEYVRFATTNKNQVPLVIERPIRVAHSYEKTNILHGKKYIACGDSFTAGDFTGYTDSNGLSGKNSPEIYDSVMGVYKTYPWWIATRNSMRLVNDGISGSVMALSKDYLDDPENYAVNNRSPFSLNRYKNIPDDADYVTIWFGINDSGKTYLGSIDDTDNTTFYGAWNVVLEWIITNRPYAKIGIIITNDGKAEYRNAEREIAKKWGIPYLDLMGDDKVPVLWSREDGMTSEVNSLRGNAFKVSSTNGHPNVKAHEYMSTFIENFLRSL